MRSKFPYFDFSRREIIVLAIILFTLFFLTPTHYLNTSYLTPQPTSDGGHDETQQRISYKSEKVKVYEEVRGPIQPVTFPEPRRTWSKPASMPETSVVAHVPGWTILDNLYIFNGTILIVTSEPEKVPEPKLISSSGYEIFNGPVERAKRLPSDHDIRIITPDNAQILFGSLSAARLEGVNFINTDPKQFISHYYHWTAELLFGLWRTYSSLDPLIDPSGVTTLPPPKRMILRHVSSTKWRDYAKMNQYVMRGAFPSLGMEFSEDWDDRAQMGTPFVFDRVVLADRAAAGEGDPFKVTWRTASNAFELPGSLYWWSPIRRAVTEFAGLPLSLIAGEGVDPATKAENEQFVITYVSRQEWGRRMLLSEDHNRLIQELNRLHDVYGYEVNVVSMDKLPRSEQIALAGRTTIMMGVHGNGLTSLVWMKPTARSTVIEFFIPGGVAFDYEYTTRALGMVHYGVWDDVTFTRPDVPRYPEYPEGFHGKEIPLNGAVVAQLVHKRLTLNSEN